MSDERFLVAICDFQKLKASAIARGCEEGGSYLDYVDTGDFEERAEFETLEAATAFAIENRERDCFAAPRLYAQELVISDRDDRGRRVNPVKTWETAEILELDGLEFVGVEA